MLSTRWRGSLQVVRTAGTRTELAVGWVVVVLLLVVEEEECMALGLGSNPRHPTARLRGPALCLVSA
jgi:hypothetical protein